MLTFKGEGLKNHVNVICDLPIWEQNGVIGLVVSFKNIHVHCTYILCIMEIKNADQKYA